MSKTRAWVCADTHFGHPNIIRYRQQFSSYQEHDDTILNNILSVVGKNDTLWILGDVCLHKSRLEYVEEISKNVARLRIILGNHDLERNGMNFKDYVEIASSLHGMVKKNNCWLTHAPIHPTELRGCYNIHGHIHDKVIDDSRYYNVSMEQIDYKPVLLADVVNELKERNNDTN